MLWVLALINPPLFDCSCHKCASFSVWAERGASWKWVSSLFGSSCLVLFSLSKICETICSSWGFSLEASLLNDYCCGFQFNATYGSPPLDGKSSSEIACLCPVFLQGAWVCICVHYVGFFSWARVYGCFRGWTQRGGSISTEPLILLCWIRIFSAEYLAISWN